MVLLNTLIHVHVVFSLKIMKIERANNNSNKEYQSKPSDVMDMEK